MLYMLSSLSFFPLHTHTHTCTQMSLVLLLRAPPPVSPSSMSPTPLPNSPSPAHPQCNPSENLQQALSHHNPPPPSLVLCLSLFRPLPPLAFLLWSLTWAQLPRRFPHHGRFLLVLVAALFLEGDSDLMWTWAPQEHLCHGQCLPVLVAVLFLAGDKGPLRHLHHGRCLLIPVVATRFLEWPSTFQFQLKKKRGSNPWNLQPGRVLLLMVRWPALITHWEQKSALWRSWSALLRMVIQYSKYFHNGTSTW